MKRQFLLQANPMEKEKLLKDLSSFDPDIRKKSLSDISFLIKKGRIRKSDKPTPWINLHIHTFHSFNCEHWSPSRVIYEGWHRNLKYTGTVDFDTLAGLDETLRAGKILDVRVTGGFESRVLIDEWKDIVINSPSEPGIYYLCGKGFKRAPAENSEEGQFFSHLKDVAQDRNRKVIEKLNNYLGEVKVDYEKDVLLLTPSGNPTERHIVESYMKKSEDLLSGKHDRFWSEILSVPESAVEETRKKRPAGFLEMLRKALIKFGGPGYIAPEKENFPRLEEVTAMIEKAGGIPTGTWLDGSSKGEEDAGKFVSFLKGKGIRAITIIPERNYNFKDVTEKEKKVKKLNEFMQACMDMKMPVVCGTELNKTGQPFVDDFTKSEITVYLDYFLQSASVFF